MKQRVLFTLALMLTTTVGWAQRFTDRLDRGLVAIPASTNGGSGSGNFVSWRIFGEEYYDVTYNLYADGSKIASNLKVSNYTHTGGNASTKYQVAAVVRGVEQEKCAEVTRWQNGYLDVPVQPVIDRNGDDATTSQSYFLNDVSLGDVDGDGIAELIVKRNNGKDLRKVANKVAFNHYECYNIKGERLWTIDLGPNLMAEADEQWDLVCYDWDEDGRCELLMRGADNMIIHTADGHHIEVGNMNVDTRWDDIGYTTTGAEYLLYMEGATARPYGWDGQEDKFQPMAYPLPRFDQGEAQDEAAIWGAGILGHRPTKHFFGAPFLDGRHASIFLGRGIYTREKMVALDVNPQTHELTERWRWHCYNSSSPWFGQGFHNYAIADVDWDGRDEIVYGSMVIDDNGKGLSTTGLGHGDAQHCSDLDPYRHGQEQFTCLENQPVMNFRNATTSEIYYRWVGSADDGRALAGNFSNSYPGAMGRSTMTGMISCTADKPITEIPELIAWNDLNFRIYWDGDLLEEVLNSPGTERDAAIIKPGTGRIFLSAGCQMNNWTKNNPGATGDIFGDWREELVLRADGNTKLRIYTTPHPTQHRLYTLWHDHQYRQGMVWECLGYNQPPHVSYFVGEMEGITMAPPPLTNTGRVTVSNGAVIGTSLNDQQVLLCDAEDVTVTVSEGAQPWLFIDNAPSWVQGTDVDGTSTLKNRSEIIRQYYTHTVTGGAFTGAMRLVKQGDGTLVLPKVAQTYTGATDIWAGTLRFDGTLLQSDLWLNRFARLESNGGEFRSIKMDYDARLLPGGEGSVGTVKTATLQMGFGSRIILDMQGGQNDRIDIGTLKIEKKTWKYGPKYLTPVIEFAGTDIAEGRYLLGTVETLSGSLADIIIEGIPTNLKPTLMLEDGKLWLDIATLRQPADITWTGSESNVWDFANAQNFRITENTEASETFVEGDKVRFTDEGTKTSVTITGELYPDSIIVDATKNYTFNGTGAILGEGALVKRGSGMLTINTDNGFTGGVRLSGGVTVVKSLANTTQARGALGAMTTKAQEFIIENGAELRTTGDVRIESPITANDGIINKQKGLSLSKTVTGKRLTLKGTGIMQSSVAFSGLDTLIIQAGGLDLLNHNTPGKAVVLEGGWLTETMVYMNATYSITVPKGKSGTYYLAERSGYSNKILGEGTLTVVCPPTNKVVARTAFAANLTGFEGTLKAEGRDGWDLFVFDNSSNMSKGTLQITDGVTVKNSAKTMTLGCVKGNNGKLGGFEAAGARISEGNPTWRLGNDTNWSWGGMLTGGCNLQKVGTGRVTLTGASDHTGSTIVNEGELHFGNKATLGKSTLTVKKGAVLSGATSNNSDLTNSSYTISAGATLQVGLYAKATTGVIRFGSKNVTFASGSFLQMGISRAATATNTGGTSLDNINRLTMNATIQLHYAESFAPEVGDSVVLWKANTITGTPVLESTVIDAERGLYWDTTDLAKGILRVTDVVPTGIGNIRTSDLKPSAIYDLNGHRVTAPRKGGVYIVGGRKILY